MPRVSRKSLERDLMLGDIQDSAVHAQWQDMHPWSEALVSLTLPYGCHFGGALYENAANDSPEMEMLRLRVDPDLRRHGIGKRLVSALGRLAKSNAADTLRGQVNSQYTVMALASVFGEENLSYTDRDPVDLETVELPMTLGEAISSLERAEGFEKDREYRAIGFNVIVDLSRIAIEGLEQPLEVNDRPLEYEYR